MIQTVLKVFLTAGIVVAVAEIGKRSSTAAALLAALPLVSILSMVWLYTDTGDVRKIIALSDGIFFMVLPTLVFFVILSGLLRRGIGFARSMTISCLVMIAIYLGYAHIARRLGAPI